MHWAILFGISLFLTGVGVIDLIQKSHAILRNYPIAAHLRFLFEAIRPEMRQFEGEKDGMPFVPDEAQRVANFHRATVRTLAELTAAAGLDHPRQYAPIHISRRITPSVVVTFADVYPALGKGELLAGTDNPRWNQPWAMADAHSFRAVA